MRHYASTQVGQDHRGSVVVMGNFDGVHRGHRVLIDRAKVYASEHHCPLGVVTFSPHPRLFFNRDKNKPPMMITPDSLKEDIFAAQGFDFYVALPFDRTLANISAHAFMERILVHGLGVKAVVIGQDFGFGHHREGGVLDLQQQKSFETMVVQEVLQDDQAMPFSSSVIRLQLQEGNIRLANNLLGHPFTVHETVFRHKRTGREIGFPTANLRPMSDQVWPKFGTYAGRVKLADGRLFDAAINWGVRPTMGQQDPMYEAHLFDFEGNLYDQPLRLALLEFVRPEKKFAGLNALKAQISEDIKVVKQKLLAYPPESVHAQPISREMPSEKYLGVRDLQAIEAAAFRRMVQHFRDHPEVQNIDLMILADFCRNCLSNWYLEAAQDLGLKMSKDDARERIYGMPYATWKQQHQIKQSPKKLALLEQVTKQRRQK